MSTWGFDFFGQPIYESLPNQSTGRAGGPTTTFTFDSAHDTLSQTDPDGNVTS